MASQVNNREFQIFLCTLTSLIQTDRQTDGQTDRQTNRAVVLTTRPRGAAGCWGDRHTDRQTTDKQTDRQTELWYLQHHLV